MANNMSSFAALIRKQPFTRETQNEYYQTRAIQVKEWMLRNNNRPVDYTDILNALNIFEGDERDVALCGNLLAFMVENKIVSVVPRTHPKKFILGNT